MLSLGFSPCPNDTFIFYALVSGRLETAGLDFDLHIEDVETLNNLARTRSLDVTKVSCHAFHYLAEDYVFLRSGGAFGRGCGPLIVASDACNVGALQDRRIAIPGEMTTANLLLKLLFDDLFGRRPETVAMPFHRIMDAVRGGEVDAGVIIHESRFTFPSYGLHQVIDLGDWWERATGLPIPLGGIIAKKGLGTETTDRIGGLIRESVLYARSHTSEVMPYIRKYAQEMADNVIMQHINLYVNEYSLDIGKDGEAALAELLRRARKADGGG